MIIVCSDLPVNINNNFSNMSSCEKGVLHKCKLLPLIMYICNALNNALNALSHTHTHTHKKSANLEYIQHCLSILFTCTHKTSEAPLHPWQAGLKVHPRVTSGQDACPQTWKHPRPAAPAGSCRCPVLYHGDLELLGLSPATHHSSKPSAFWTGPSNTTLLQQALSYLDWDQPHNTAPASPELSGLGPATQHCSSKP